MTQQQDLDLIKRLRAELEAVKAEAARWQAHATQAIRDHRLANEHLQQAIEANRVMTEALRWYQEEDRKAVDAGQIETIAVRPAFVALGGKASGVCEAHQRASLTCRTCFPSPRRPRVVPAPPVARLTPS